jgi:hypothetical protein
MIRFTWVLLDPKSVSVFEDLDVGELAADGRLQRIIGFFGPPPPIPDDWPDHLEAVSLIAGCYDRRHG